MFTSNSHSTLQWNVKQCTQRRNPVLIRSHPFPQPIIPPSALSFIPLLTSNRISQLKAPLVRVTVLQRTVYTINPAFKVKRKLTIKSTRLSNYFHLKTYQDSRTFKLLSAEHIEVLPTRSELQKTAFGAWLAEQVEPSEA